MQKREMRGTHLFVGAEDGVDVVAHCWSGNGARRVVGVVDPHTDRRSERLKEDERGLVGNRGLASSFQVKRRAKECSTTHFVWPRHGEEEVGQESGWIRREIEELSNDFLCPCGRSE